MLKLPVCPYCKTIYSNKDVKQISKQKEEICYHCKNKFQVSYIKGRIIYFTFVILVLVLINFGILKLINGSNIYECLAVTIIFISFSLLLLPRTVKFNKIQKSNK